MQRVRDWFATILPLRRYTLIMDAENQNSCDAGVKKQKFVHAGKVPLPLRRGHVLSDVLTIVLGLVVVAYGHFYPHSLRPLTSSCDRCIGQSYWIERLREGTKRIPNDDFDHLFNRRDLRGDSSIWNDTYQAFIHKANPVPVHSHNDYTRRIPLFEALASGCISIEADVHLVGGELLVGHSARGLKTAHSLRTMYLEPLQRMLESQNTQRSNVTFEDSWRGIFDNDPKQTVVLLVDHKTSGRETFAQLYAQLQPLRELDYLTYWNGSDKVMRPLTIVATGKAPFESVTELRANRRDIFWDAPLDALPSASDDFTSNPPRFRYNQSNSHYASTPYRNAVFLRPTELDDSLLMTPQGKDLAATQAQQAAARGLLTRYWDTPSSPPNLRDSLWRYLIGVGGGVINMDDMGVVRDKGSGWGRIPELAV